MTFLEKYQLLKKSVPVPAVTIPNSVNCDFVDYCYWCKNCYYCFNGHKLVDGIYTNAGWGNKLVDCDLVTESEKCYKCIDSNACNSCTYLIECNSCTDCHFSAFLNSCIDCFGCIALTHKKYCILNIQYGKDEYFKKVEKMKKEKPEKILAQMLELKQQIPHPASQQFNSVNCPYGNFIYNSKNSYWCFNNYTIENSGYNFVSNNVKNCWDVWYSGGDSTKKTFSEQCYEYIYSANCYECAFIYNCHSCTNSYYSENLINCSDCFGCVGLKNKKYCILNNQLSKEQYGKAVSGIKKELGWREL